MSVRTQQQLKDERRAEIRDLCLDRVCRFRTEYFREQRLRLDLEETIAMLQTENRSYREAMAKLMQAVGQVIKPQDKPAGVFKDLLSDIPGIVALYQFVREDTINIWIIIEKENFDSEMKIAAAQAEILRRFQKSKFHFMVFPRSLVNDHTIPKDAIRV